MAGRFCSTITATSGRLEDAQVAVFDLSTHETKVILRGGSHAHYVAPGHLVYGAAGELRAAPFDLQQLTVTSAPVTILPRVLTTPDGGVDFDIARTGTLVYAQGTVSSSIRTLVWVDRLGNETPLNLPARTYLYARLSPDGSRIALDIREQMNDIWVWDIARETLTPVAADPAMDRFPVWMPGGRRLLFASNRNGTTSILAQAADGSGQPERIVESTTDPIPTAVTPDGKQLILMEGYTVPGPESRDVVMLPFATGRIQPLVKTPFVDQNGVISPDGRWLVYESDETGQVEVHVRPFPAGGTRALAGVSRRGHAAIVEPRRPRAVLHDDERTADARSG